MAAKEHRVRSLKAIKQSFKRRFEEYCANSSIHGLRYFGQDRSIFDRCWWGLLLIVCLSICGWYVVKMYDKWENRPVIVTFATKEMPIYEIPFPAVTICMESKIDPRKFNLTRVNEKIRNNQTLDPREEKYFNYVSSVCYTSKWTEKSSQIYKNVEIYEIMEDVMPKFEFFSCGVWGLINSCEELFTPIITDEGPCFTFNMQDRSAIYNDDVFHYSNYHKVNRTSLWNVEDGYKLLDEQNTEGYPRRALLSGARYSMEFDMKILKSSIENDCRNSLEGFRVLLHSPMRIPNPGEEYFRLSFDKATIAVITPSIIKTAHAVKKYKPEKRFCNFQEEVKLKFFKHYSQTNCNLECLTNATLLMCGCVQFYMPRRNTTRICGTKESSCVMIAEYEYQESNLNKALGKATAVEVCDCLPLCTDISYKTSVSETRWHWSKNHQPKNESDELRDYYFTRLSLYFPNRFFIGSERNELYGVTDFLANLGGLLSLFTGFSVFCLMEIIYYLVVKVIYN